MQSKTIDSRGKAMLNLLWLVVVLMVIAALLGFGGVVSSLQSVAWFLIVAAVVLAVVGFVTGRRAL
ncbi:gsr2640 [Gloeobacter violaceus PCC 7421]|jgi:uncharacterized membrane protein YtjA (UPF0391 family)|nr:gsr2640 [Gloeobacter violaceus PCC 7421]